MDLKAILNRHSSGLPKTGSYISLTTANSSAVWPLIESLELRELMLIRTLHLELTLESESQDSVEQFLIDHIDHNLSQLLDSSFACSKYDRNTEMGFETRKKMKLLFSALKARAYQTISSEEFFEVYTEWLEKHSIQSLMTSQSSREINEIFTFFIIQEEPEEFVKDLSIAIENMLDEVYFDYSKRLKIMGSADDQWNLEAERLFAALDEERKGHLDLEAVQFWALSVLLFNVTALEPILVRKQVSNFLGEMKHTNGLVTMRGWKNYLLKKNWVRIEDLQQLYKNLTEIIEVWKQVRVNTFGAGSLAGYSALRESEENLPSIWSQCVEISVQGLMNFQCEAERLKKFLRFSGLLLGATPNLSTKGVVYLQGTFIREASEFAVYLMSNYLQLSGQYHTSASISSMTQQSINALSSDPRFIAIRKALQAFDGLLNIILYEIIANFSGKVKENNNDRKRYQYSSNTSILMSSSKKGKAEGIRRPQGIENWKAREEAEMDFGRSASFVKASERKVGRITGDRSGNSTPIKRMIEKPVESRKKIENITPSKQKSTNSIPSQQKSADSTPNRQKSGNFASDRQNTRTPGRTREDKQAFEASKTIKPQVLSTYQSRSSKSIKIGELSGKNFELKSVFTKAPTPPFRPLPSKSPSKPAAKEPYDVVMKRLGKL